MTRRSGNNRIVGEDVLDIHPADAVKKCIRTGEPVRIKSARGEVILNARVTDEVNPGVLYATFHFPESPVNILSGEGHDAETLCPEYKLVAVDIERADWIGAHPASW